MTINAGGEVEPCASAHFAVDNVRRKVGLEEVLLANPPSKVFQNRQPFYDNHRAPCQIFDNPQALRDIAREAGAHPPYDGAGTLLTGSVAAHRGRVSAEWRCTADAMVRDRKLRAKLKAEAQVGSKKSMST